MSHLPESSPIMSISAGQRLQFLIPGGHRTLLSAEVGNQLFTVFNAMLNLKIVRIVGNGVNDARVDISSQNIIITLKDA